MGGYRDLSGHTFNGLTVICRIGKQGTKYIYSCMCVCGNIVNVNASNLVTGNTKSCGCRRIENTVRQNKDRSLPDNTAAKNGLYTSYRKGALTRGYTFDLTKSEFLLLTSLNCFYCGSKPSRIFKQNGCIGEYVCNGIDRVDNSLGYTLRNSVPCCEDCNRAKRVMRQVDFIKWVLQTADHIRATGLDKVLEEE